MAKTDSKRSTTSRRKPAADIIPARWQHPAAIALLLLTLVVFFWPVIGGGKSFLAPDTIASHSWDTLLKDAKTQGEFPLWNPYIFCGMPGYASLTFAGDRTFDISATVLGYASAVFQFFMLNSALGWLLFYYFVFAAGWYVLAFSKVGSKVASLVAALGATFSAYIIVLPIIGHNTKIPVLAFLPWILLIVERLRTKFDFRLALVLALLVHFSFIPAHIQMIFYMFLALGIYLLFMLVRSIVVKEEWRGIVRAGVVLAAASVLAFAMDADKYLSVWEYNPYSIRGSAPAVQVPEEGGKTQEGGLGYDYATNWSFGVGEVMTFLVPSWYGFGPLEYSGPLTREAVRINMYWGPQPFVDGAQYMGIVILAFAVMGFWRNRRDPFVQFAGITILFSILVSFGKEFSLVYDLMFKYFPMFNKFRIPSMILILVQVFVPVLAAYGVRDVLAQVSGSVTPASEKRWNTGMMILGGLTAFSFVGRGVVQSVYESFFPISEMGSHIARSVGTGQTAVVQEFYNFVVATVLNDITIALVMLTIVFGAVWLARKRSMSASAVAAVIIVVALADLWRIGFRPMDPKPRTEQKEIFTQAPYIKALAGDSSTYRVIQLINGQTQYDNTLAYWRVQNAYGYQGAKLRAYQDVVDVAGLGNPLVQQLMNVKYVVMNQPDSAKAAYLAYDGPDMKIYQNPVGAERAFFVNRYETATGLQILNNMAAMSFNPREVAYVMEDPKIAVEAPQAGARVAYVRYGLQNLEASVNATGNNLLFLSEAWYPNGWKAFIDGVETPIHRLNYMFRGVVVPKGEHKLEMRFEPRGFLLGKNLSLAANLLVIGGLGFAGFDWWKKRRTAEQKLKA